MRLRVVAWKSKEALSDRDKKKKKRKDLQEKSDGKKIYKTDQKKKKVKNVIPG